MDDSVNSHEHGPDQDHHHGHGDGQVPQFDEPGQRDHEHADHGHDHEGDHDHSLTSRLAHLLHLHGHSHGHGDLAVDKAFAETNEGIRTVWIAMGLLLLTTVLQVVVVAFSGSVALLADTVHNLGDALNSVPLLIAFYLARRAATRRYTYGFHRAEDVAGIFIVLSIALSAAVVFWESFQKLIDPQPLQNLGWVAAAAIIGFLGNEAVAVLQIRVGRRIGSAALVADGLHARTDGLTSLAVLLAAAGSWLGFPIVDPIVGVAIGVAILFITRDAMRTMWYRLMDAVEPGLVDQAEVLAGQQSGVKAVRRVRMRWVGHRLFGDVSIAVEPRLTTVESHEIAERVRHALFHDIERLGEIMVHVDPWSEKPDGFHELTVHHEPVPSSIP